MSRPKCLIAVNGVQSGGYKQINPKGTVYVKSIRDAEWWGTTNCGKTPSFISPTGFGWPNSSMGGSLYSSQGSGLTKRNWKADIGENFFTKERFSVPKYVYWKGIKGTVKGRWYVGGTSYKSPSIRMTIIQDNKAPISQAFITSITDSEKNPINSSSSTNDPKPTIKGYVDSKLEEDARVEITANYKKNNKKIIDILGTAKVKDNLSWTLSLDKGFPDGFNLKQKINAKVIDRAGNHTTHDSKEILVSNIPQARAAITHINNIKTKNNRSLNINNIKPLITGKLTNKLAKGETVEIWGKFKVDAWHKKSFSKDKLLGYAKVDKKNWSFEPKKELQQDRRGIYNMNHIITTRVINSQGKHSESNKINFTLDTEAPSIFMTNAEDEVKYGRLQEPEFERLKLFSRVTDPRAIFIRIGIDKKYHRFIKSSNINAKNGSIKKIFISQINNDMHDFQEALFIAVLPDKNSAGNVVLNVKQGIIKDDAGNENKAAKISIPFDTRTKDVTPEDGALEPIVEDLNPGPDDSKNPVDPAKPSLKTSEVEIAEDAKPGTTIIDLADANSGEDTDNAGNKLTYSIKTGNDDGLFSIDPDSGVITIATGKSLNYDTKAAYELQVEAYDGSQSGSAVITIKVKDVSGYPVPADTSPSLEDKTIQVNESIKPGDEIVDLSDQSGGDTNSNGDALAYAISSGNEDELFKINSSNGKIYLSEERIPTAKFLDYETKNSFTLGISASADGKTDTAQITVQVQNQPEQFSLGTPASYSWGGDDITGDISNSATSNWISLSIDKGQSVSLGFNGSGTLDSQNNVYVNAVYNDFGHLVDENTYFKEFNLTSYDIIAPYSGTYYVEVKASNGETGSYAFGATDNGPALG